MEGDEEQTGDPGAEGDGAASWGDGQGAGDGGSGEQGGAGAGGSWDAVQVSADCPDGAVQESYELNTTYSATGRAFITNGRAGFAVDKERSDPVTVTVVLSDEEGNPGSASGALSWGADERGRQCLTFSGFPSRADGDQMTSVNYTISLVNDANEREGTSVQVEVY